MMTRCPSLTQPRSGSVTGTAAGPSNSWGVAPTPIQPAPTGQLKG